jgi:uncharacterized protein
LALALAFPALAVAGSFTLRAELRWGKERLPLRFETRGAPLEGVHEVALLTDEAEALRSKLGDHREWSVSIGETILDLPGVGAIVPDLVLKHRRTRRLVHIEVLGYWSRDAVWKRVDLVERGLAQRVIFCVSERLRVSEEVLPPSASATLLVYKGTIPAKALLERAQALIDRG